MSKPVWSLMLAILVTAPLDALVPWGAAANADDTPGEVDDRDAPTLQRFQVERPRIGTIVTLQVYSDSRAVANKATAAAFDRLDALNAILSNYEPESELNRLTRDARPGVPVPVSEPLFHVLERAAAVSKASDGAFDVTVGRLTKLWRQVRRRKALPEKEVLAQARAGVGWQHVRLDARARTVALAKPDVQLDLGGIAKGYMADEMLRVLREQGCPRAIVDAGGDMAIGDPPPGETGWTVQVAGLDGKGTDTLRLANVGIATSGDLYQAVEIDGVRYSHILDPRTGLGLTERSSVTVIAPDGLLADAHASAISVLGPKQGLALAQTSKGVEVRIGFVQGECERWVETKRFGRRE